MIACRRSGVAAALGVALLAASVLFGPCSAAAAEPVPVLRIDPAQGGARLQLNFPQEAYGDPNRLLYRVNGSKDVELDLQVFAGEDEVGFPIELKATLLVDGQQARFSVDGGRAAKTAALALPSPGIVTQAKVSLESKRLSAGVHTVDLLLWRTDGVPFPCWSFLVTKGTPRTPNGAASKGFLVTGGGARPAANFWLSSDPRPLFGPLRAASPQELESVALRAHLERSTEAEVPLELAVAALLDDTQVAFEGSGSAPAVALGSGQMADAKLGLGALPRESSGHRLVFFLLRRPLFSERGRFLEARFSPTRQVGGLKW